MATIIFTPEFEKTLRKAPVDVQNTVKTVLEGFRENPEAAKYRLHLLTGTKPPRWKIDVFPNHSWQISMLRNGDVFTLLTLARHKQHDRIR